MDDTGKMKGASRSYILSEVEASLRRLQTDWIDLYQTHSLILSPRSRRLYARWMISSGREKFAFLVARIFPRRTWQKPVKYREN